MNIEKKLKKIIIDVGMLDIEANDITNETILTVDLEYNSIKLVELIVEIENEFGIQLEDDDLDIEKLSVYNKLLDMITTKVVNVV